jgi:DNA polymerase III epsilon subunit-like protein
MNVLVLDVETTGLLPRLKKGEKDNVSSNNLPYITQLSFILYDSKTRNMIKSYNSYVRPPPHVEIDAKVTELTGITREMLDDETIGRDIVTVLADLYEAYCECDIVVAHNLEFDSRMIAIETERNYARLDYEIAPYTQWMFDELYCKLTYVKLQCTMQMGTKMCNIKATNSYGTYTKFPTLLELYIHLFDKTPENLHNSMMDVLVCLRCYLKIQCGQTITDRIFEKHINACF